MSLSSREIKEILAVLEESGWDEAEVSIGDVTLAVSKGSAPRSEPVTPPTPEIPQAVAATPTPEPASSDAAPPDPQANGRRIDSPSVGVFWRAPEPGAPPFVEQGSQVEPGQPLCIVEIMKLMQQVVADAAGVITAIHVENGEQVEFGTPLFSIAPAG